MAIGNLLSHMTGRMGNGHRLKEEMALLLWEQVVGDSISRHTSPLRVISGIMTVAVDSSVWLQELALQREEIRKRLNARIGDDVVKDIKFCTGPPPVISPPASREEFLLPDREDVERAAKISGLIEDKGLAASFSRFLEHELCRQRVIRAQGWVKCNNCGSRHRDKDGICDECRQK